MPELQVVKKESADKLEVFILCPALSKKEVVASFDKKDGVLEVMGVPEKKAISEFLDLDISGKIDISPKYRCDEVKMKIEDGLAIITFGLAESVTLLKAD